MPRRADMPLHPSLLVGALFSIAFLGNLVTHMTRYILGLHQLCDNNMVWQWLRLEGQGRRFNEGQHASAPEWDVRGPEIK